MSRLLELIWLISSAPRYWSRRRLAEKYEVSERQITKDLDLIRNGLRFSVRRSPTGYFFETVPRLPTTSFSFEEALALLLAVRVGGTIAGVDGEALAAAVGRLESVFPGELRAVLRQAEGDTLKHQQRLQWLAALNLAIAQQQQVRLVYAAVSHGGTVTERIVDPYAIIPYGRSWHFVGYCHLREDTRLFKLDRIQQLHPLTSTFTQPASFDLAAYLQQGWGLMRGVAGPTEQVVLRFAQPVASFVAEEQWHPSQAVTWEADRSAIFQVQVVVTPEFQRWVFGYGSKVRVLAPASLREWVRQEALLVAAQAGEG